MSLLNNKNFPPPPPGLTGWPWTEETNPAIYDPKIEWPKISIVTPSYNQGQFIEETIRSILLQNYPNLEYIIMDGGSTDETVEILKKYDPWISHWESQSDRGQTHAINKGFKRLNDTIANWINSDDVFLPDAFYTVAQQMDEQTDFLWGQCLYITPEEKEIPGKGPEDNLKILHASDFPYSSQPSCFYRSSVFQDVGYLDEQFHFSMDFDFFVRVGLNKNMKRIPEQLTKFRWHGESKTSNLQDIHNANRRVIMSKILNAFKREFPELGLERFVNTNDQYKVSNHYTDAEKKQIIGNTLKTLSIILYRDGDFEDLKKVGHTVKKIAPEIYHNTYVKNLHRRALYVHKSVLLGLRKLKTLVGS